MYKCKTRSENNCGYIRRACCCRRGWVLSVACGLMLAGCDSAPDWNTRVAFLWFRTQRLFRTAVEAFRPFFLATKASDVSLLARWVEPADVLAVSKGLEFLGVTPDQLRARHRADMRLARELASSVELARIPETSILWFEEGELDGETLGKLEKMGLVWRLPGRGLRVLCRSDVVAGARAHKKGSSLP